MSSYNAYESYYRQQAGAGLPYFAGAPSQRGHGLGSIFSGLLRSALPVLKTVGKNVGKSALKAGVTVAGDMIEGRNFENSLRNRAREEIGTMTRKLNKYVSPSPKLNSRRRAVKRKRSAPPRIVKSKRDIFG